PRGASIAESGGGPGMTKVSEQDAGRTRGSAFLRVGQGRIKRQRPRPRHRGGWGMSYALIVIGGAIIGGTARHTLSTYLLSLAGIVLLLIGALEIGYEHSRQD